MHKTVMLYLFSILMFTCAVYGDEFLYDGWNTILEEGEIYKSALSDNSLFLLDYSQDSIYRYDIEYDTTAVYTAEHLNIPSGQSIMPLSITVDNEGLVWCGLGNGCLGYDGSDWTFFSYEETGVYSCFSTLAVDDTIWFFGDDLVWYDKKTDSFTKKEDFPYAMILDSINIGDNTIWFTDGSLLLCMDKDANVIYKFSEEYFSNDFSHEFRSFLCLAYDGSRFLYIGSNISLIKFDTYTHEFTVYPLRVRNLFDITYDPVNDQMICAGDELCIFDGNDFQYPWRITSCSTVELDDDRNLWVGRSYNDSHSLIQRNLNNTTDVNDELPEALPTVTAYPNPFNPSTAITFTLPVDGHTTLTVYNLAGQKVATLVDRSMSAGSHTAVFNGNGYASGMYFYRLKAGGTTYTGKMLLMK